MSGKKDNDFLNIVAGLALAGLVVAALYIFDVLPL